MNPDRSQCVRCGKYEAPFHLGYCGACVTALHEAEPYTVTPEAHRQLSKIGRIWIAILEERKRQEALRATGKFSETCASPAMSDLKKLAVLTEEFGEVAKEVCEYEERPSTLTREKLQAELVQVAAVCVAWLEALQK